MTRFSSLLRDSAREFSAALSDDRLTRAFCALLWLGLAYRLDLYSFALLEQAGPFGLHVGALRVFRHALFEPLFALGLVTCAWLVGLAARGLVRAQGVREGSMLALLVVVGFVYGLQRHLIDALNVGISYELLVEAAGATPVRELVRQFEAVDLAYVLGPAVLFLVQRTLAPRVRKLRDLSIVVSLSALLALGIGGLNEKALPRDATALVEPPVSYALGDILDAWTHPPEQRFPTVAQFRGSAGMQLTDPAFGGLTVGSPDGVPGVCRSRRCSILMVIMESVGARYVFDPKRAGVTPMPTLERLSKQGMWLGRHHSTNNSSPHSIFSILTGLYPLPAPSLFSTTPRVSVPSLFSLLPPDYEKFFYSPGPLEWYFPYGLLKNSGVEEIVDESEIPGRRPRSPTAANEIDATDAFIERLGRARRPFVAAYYSYLPHYPYRDYGPEQRIIPIPARRIDRYYNNLRVLDTQLERIVSAARKQVPADELVVMIVGDHGEAFGQHRGNWVHLTQSYQENFETVAFFLHDTIFPPRREGRLTSHVDLLPTLLDAVGVDYEPRLVQGNSLLRTGARRDYTFVYGNENTVGALSEAGIKTLASFRSGRAWAFDLLTDPRERHPRRLVRGDAQLEASLQYHLFQRAQLPRYNEAARQGEAFQGLRHPRAAHALREAREFDSSASAPR